MKDAFVVDEGESIEYLLENNFDLLLIDLVVLGCDVLLEVVVVVVEDDLQQLLLGLVEDLNQRHDVGVLLQGFQQRDLAQGTRWDPLFLVLEFDVLDGHQTVALIAGFEHLPERTLSNLANFFIIVDFFHFLKLI